MGNWQQIKRELGFGYSGGGSHRSKRGSPEPVVGLGPSIAALSTEWVEASQMFAGMDGRSRKVKRHASAATFPPVSEAAIA